MSNLEFETDVIFVDERIGDKCYTGIVNSSLTEPTIALGKNVATETDTEGHSKKLTEQDFDTKKEAILFLEEYRNRLKLALRT